MKTANGTVRADAGTIDRLEIGGIEARKLKVVISPGLGDTDILGMNFLSALESWRVEGRTLILVPGKAERSDENTSELQSLMRHSYAHFCLQNKKQDTITIYT